MKLLCNARFNLILKINSEMTSQPESEMQKDVTKKPKTTLDNASIVSEKPTTEQSTTTSQATTNEPKDVTPQIKTTTSESTAVASAKTNNEKSEKFEQVKQMIENPKKPLNPSFHDFIDIFDHWQGLGLTTDNFTITKDEPFGGMWKCTIKEYVHQDYTAYAVISDETGDVVSIRIKGNDGNTTITPTMAQAMHGAMACFEHNFQLHDTERFNQLGISENGGNTTDLKKLEYESIGGVYYRSRYSKNMNCYILKVGRVPD